MPEKITFQNGRTYIGHPSVVFGDYGGAGSVGAANIKDLLEEAGDDVEVLFFSDIGDPEGIDAEDAPTSWALHVRGGHASEAVYLLEGGQPRSDVPDENIPEDPSDFDRTAEVLRALDDYPLLDDETASEIELEWECEAWESWAKSELLTELEDDSEEDPDALRDYAEGLDDDTLHRLYRTAAERENIYPEPEYSGVHIDIEGLADTFRLLVEVHRAGLEIPGPCGIGAPEDIQNLEDLRIAITRAHYTELETLGQGALALSA